MADSSQTARVEHPSVVAWQELKQLLDPRIVVAWQELKQLLDPRIVVAYESDPHASLDDHLIGRRELACLVVKAAHRVIDTIDQNP